MLISSNRNKNDTIWGRSCDLWEVLQPTLLGHPIILSASGNKEGCADIGYGVIGHLRPDLTEHPSLCVAALLSPKICLKLENISLTLHP